MNRKIVDIILERTGVQGKVTSPLVREKAEDADDEDGDLDRADAE